MRAFYLVFQTAGISRRLEVHDPLVGIELMHMIKKRQMRVEDGDEGRTAAELFYSLAA